MWEEIGRIWKEIRMGKQWTEYAEWKNLFSVKKKTQIHKFHEVWYVDWMFLEGYGGLGVNIIKI